MSAIAFASSDRRNVAHSADRNSCRGAATLPPVKVRGALSRAPWQRHGMGGDPRTEAPPPKPGIPYRAVFLMEAASRVGCARLSPETAHLGMQVDIKSSPALLDGVAERDSGRSVAAGNLTRAVSIRLSRKAAIRRSHRKWYRLLVWPHRPYDDLQSHLAVARLAGRNGSPAGGLPVT
jgi:hypothetical protein